MNESDLNLLFRPLREPALRRGAQATQLANAPLAHGPFSGGPFPWMLPWV